MAVRRSAVVPVPEPDPVEIEVLGLWSGARVTMGIEEVRIKVSDPVVGITLAFLGGVGEVTVTVAPPIGVLPIAPSVSSYAWSTYTAVSFDSGPFADPSSQVFFASSQATTTVSVYITLTTQPA